VHDATALVRQDDEHVEELERDAVDDDEVDRGEHGQVVRKERAPRLRGAP
jgi:hypothetical protein